MTFVAKCEYSELRQTILLILSPSANFNFNLIHQRESLNKFTLMDGCRAFNLLMSQCGDHILKERLEMQHD